MRVRVRVKGRVRTQASEGVDSWYVGKCARTCIDSIHAVLGVAACEIRVLRGVRLVFDWVPPHILRQPPHILRQLMCEIEWLASSDVSSN